VFAALAAAAPAAADTAERANAGPTRELALAQTLEVAVRQTPALERAAIDVAVAEATALESLGLDDWIVTGTGAWSTTQREPVAGNPFQSTGFDSYSLAAGVSRGLSTGGVVSVNADARRSETDFVVNFGEPSSFDQSSKEVSVGLNVGVTQPLLRGRGKKVARATQRQAAIARDAATLAGEVAAQDTVRDVINAYWELAYAAREIEIRTGSLELAKEQLRLTLFGIEAGAVAPTEALAVEQGIAVREEAILLAEIVVSERSLELRRLAGLEVGPGEIDIVATEPLVVSDREFDLDATLARALERNPALALIAKNGESARIEVEVTENGIKPVLDFAAGAGPEGNSSKTGDAFERLVKLQSFTLSASLTYRQELGNRGAKGAHERAVHKARRVTVDLAEAKRETAVAVVRAVNLVRSARKRIEVTGKAIALAEKNLENERTRFEAGDATNFDMLQRQDEIEQAKLSQTRAIVDYLEAVVVVDSLTADLLGRYGITITEASGS
jgi:outer membrane protein TolC